MCSLTCGVLFFFLFFSDSNAKFAGAVVGVLVGLLLLIAVICTLIFVRYGRMPSFWLHT